ncbi:MAG: MBL fold metallo-hydrolase [Tissierellia bacterium]|nr:MBL fold metallo-hydrolase [Tissierellia bacterium]
MEFKFANLSSGSSGNASYIETKHSKVLVDAGFCGRKLEELLDKINIKGEEIDAIFITHEHSDHMKGAGVLSRKYNIPILANEKTWMAMDRKIGKIKDENILVFRNDYDFNYRDLNVHPVSTYHDCAQSCGYIFYGNKKKVSIVTDTGMIDDNIIQKITGSDLYLFEANHDIDLLQTGNYPYHLKQRIFSNKGHLSNIDAAAFLSEALVGKGEQIFLAHLSQDNNRPDLAFSTVNDYLTDLGFDTKRDIHLEIANRHFPNGPVEIK